MTLSDADRTEALNTLGTQAVIIALCERQNLEDALKELKRRLTGLNKEKE